MAMLYSAVRGGIYHGPNSKFNQEQFKQLINNTPKVEVKNGDTLSQIAQKNLKSEGLPADAIAIQNRVQTIRGLNPQLPLNQNPDRVNPGEQLRVPNEKFFNEGLKKLDMKIDRPFTINGERRADRSSVFLDLK